MSKFYITCAIDYPNALPHIGTAFEKLGADVQARWHRMCGDDVYFLMGNDENTQKIVAAAVAKPGSGGPQKYVNDMARRFQEVWKQLDISNDDFIQTSEPCHHQGVNEFISTVYRAGYIYKKPYVGLYCNGCEEFKTPNSLTNGKCPNHPNLQIEQVEEENYFFALSEFREELLKLLHRRVGPDGKSVSELTIEPESRYNEVMSVLNGPLEDISISRTNQGWGIPIPWDDSQVIYVWFDALLNYLTGIGFGADHQKFKKWWPADCHLIGKDITRFHCIIFPAMIMAYNDAFDDGPAIDLPRKIYAHGFLYQRKDNNLAKIAKSGNFVNPSDIVEQFGVDAYRYYFLAKCRYHDDSEFSYEHFVDVYNADLANNLGNLVSRVNAMITKYFDRSLPYIPRTEIRLNDSENPYARSGQVSWASSEWLDRYKLHVEAYEYNHALQMVWELLDNCNGYVEQMKPWELANNDQEATKLAVVLRNCVSCLRLVSVLLKPFLPQTSETIYRTFFPFTHDASLTLTQVEDKLDWKYLNRMYHDEDLEHMDMDGPVILLDKVTLFPRINK
jgi:methionyl-tRNA synthetase